jgi:hypothetical protein
MPIAKPPRTDMVEDEPLSIRDRPPQPVNIRKCIKFLKVSNWKTDDCTPSGFSAFEHVSSTSTPSLASMPANVRIAMMKKKIVLGRAM